MKGWGNCSVGETSQPLRKAWLAERWLKAMNQATWPRGRRKGTRWHKTFVPLNEASVFVTQLRSGSLYLSYDYSRAPTPSPGNNLLVSPLPPG